MIPGQLRRLGRQQTKPDRRTARIAIGARGHIADDLAIPQNRLVVVQQGPRVAELDETEEGPLPFGLPGQIGLPPNEGNVLAGLADKIQPHLMGRFRVGHVMPPMQEALLDAQRIERLTPDQTQTKALSGRQQELEQVLGPVRRDEDLPAKFTAVGQALRSDAGMTDVEGLMAVEGKAALERSISVTAASRSRDLGPMTASTPKDGVTSRRRTSSPG